MTPKERRDAQIELRDYALELETPTMEYEKASAYIRRNDRIRLLLAVAAELDRVPEEQ